MSSRKRWCTFFMDKPVKCSSRKALALKAAKRTATSGHSGLVLARVCDRNGKRCSVLTIAKNGKLRWKKDPLGPFMSPAAGAEMGGLEGNFEALEGTSPEHYAKMLEYRKKAFDAQDAANVARERGDNEALGFWRENDGFWSAKQGAEQEWVDPLTLREDRLRREKAYRVR